MYRGQEHFRSFLWEPNPNQGNTDEEDAISTSDEEESDEEVVDEV